MTETNADWARGCGLEIRIFVAFSGNQKNGRRRRMLKKQVFGLWTQILMGLNFG
jgi:hypothetical protein